MSNHLVNGQVKEFMLNTSQTKQDVTSIKEAKHTEQHVSNPPKEASVLPFLEENDNKESDGSGDLYSYLDWKDGTATLPGIILFITSYME